MGSYMSFLKNYVTTFYLEIKQSCSLFIMLTFVEYCSDGRFVSMTLNGGQYEVWRLS
jgi:hypothetical protein